MSQSIKRAKFQGDPGLFGFLGGLARKATGLVGGLGIPGISGGARIASRGLAAVLGAKSRIQPRAVVSGGAGGFMLPPARSGVTQMRLGPGTAPMGPRNGAAPPAQPRGSQMAVQMVGPRGECPAGFRPNKTGYWVTSSQGTPSFVSPGERCVRRRRRNPTNIRALDRAMSRVISANRLREKLKGWPTAKRC